MMKTATAEEKFDAIKRVQQELYDLAADATEAGEMDRASMFAGLSILAAGMMALAVPTEPST